MTIPEWAEYASDYNFMLRDAHRRPAQALRAPSVVWHTAYLRPTKLDDNEWYSRVEHRIISVLIHALRYMTHCDPDGAVRVSNLHHKPLLIDKHKIEHNLTLVLLRKTYSFLNLRATDISEPEEKNRLEQTAQAQRYETVVIAGVWDGLHYWIRFEAFEEYFTMTCALNHVQLKSKTINRLEASIPTIAEFCNQRYLDIGGNTPAFQPRTLPPEVTSHVRSLYDGIWDAFAIAILGNGGNDAGSRHVLFANFRGLVLPIRKRVESERRDSSDQTAIDPVTVPLVDRDWITRIRGAMGALSSREASRWVETILPLLVALDTGDEAELRHPPFEATEFTFSLFGGKRYLYGSGFGTQYETSRDSNDGGTPLSYILLAFHDDWRHIGRTVLRLNTLGTLRTASLFEVQRLMSRDQILTRLESELRRYSEVGGKQEDLERARADALKGIAVFLDSLDSEKQHELKISDLQVEKLRYYADPAILQSVDTRILSFIRVVARKKQAVARVDRDLYVTQVLGALQNAMVVIKREFPSSDLRSEKLKLIRQAIRNCEIYFSCGSVNEFRSTVLFLVNRALNSMDSVFRGGGISYRVTRSNYLRSLFKTLADALRIDRVTGYQPYDVYVRHRLDRAYGLMQAIDARFRQISDLERALRQRLENERMRHHQRVIQQLQDNAEIGFLLILAPYYFGHIVEGILDAMRPLLIRPHFLVDHENPAENFRTFSFALGVIIGLTVGSWIIIRRRRKRETELAERGLDEN